MKEVDAMKIANFTEAHAQLRQFYNKTSRYQLDTMQKFMAFLGNPQDTLKVIHVAGTSGKTSTAYYAAALLQAEGYTVGLTVSPHVDEVNERVQVNLTPLPEAVFCKELGEFLDMVAASGLTLSYFEVMVGFAYWYFAKVQVDYAVIEVGLGGRIDSTNVVNRLDKICVITNIGFDHTKILGDTLPQIAFEKAGIITPQNDVFTHRQDEEVLDVIANKCRAEQATLHIVDEVHDPALAGLPLFQQHNFHLAQAAVDAALKRNNKILNMLSIKKAVSTYIPARMEIREHSGKTVIVDGAHNGQKLQTLLKSVAARYPGKSIAALIAFVGGDERRMQEGLQEIIKAANYCVITEFTTEQDVPKTSVPATHIAEFMAQQDYKSFAISTEPKQALAAVLQRPEDIVLVTGSFYLLNHIRPLMLNK